MSDRLRTLIIDDEPRARGLIRKMLIGDSSIEIVGECGDGYQAIEAIKQKGPDLIFLDVQMPEIDGFAVLRQVRAEAMPAVVFVTAFDRYAVRAFEEHAVDYLLKPFDKERFLRTLEHAKRRIVEQRSSQQSDTLARLLAQAKGPGKFLDRITVKKDGRMLLLNTREIDWIEAEDNYVLLHGRNGPYLLRQTLTNLEARLDPDHFIRVHRGSIINIDALAQFTPEFHGGYRLDLKSGKQLSLSRSYRDKFFAKFGYPC
jgi:two-component system, LytTR family, response regulator